MVRSIRLSWFVALVMGVSAAPLFAGGCLELVGRWPYGPAIAVAVSDENAYIVSGSSLLVADVVDPSSPVVTGRVTLPDVAYLVDVAEGFAYVVTESNEIQIIDIRLPSDPVIVGSLQLPDQARRVAVADGYLYVALGDVGLFLFDVSTPSMPTFVETIDGEAFDVVVSGRYAYVGSAYSLRSLDVAVPTSAVESGSAPGSFAWGSIAVSGSRVRLFAERPRCLRCQRPHESRVARAVRRVCGAAMGYGCCRELRRDTRSRSSALVYRCVCV